MGDDASLARSQPAAERRLLRAVEDLREELFDFAARLVRVPTVNPPGEAYAECAELMTGELSRCGFETRRIVAEGRPEHTARHPRVNLLASRAGSGTSPALHFNGHVDVVPAGAGWSVDPFAGALRDGRLWGRGSADMKAGLACAVYACEAIRRAGVRLAGPLEVSATVDEETGGQAGVRYLAEQGHLDPLRVGWVVIPEPFSPQRICVGHRGVYWFRLVTRGRTAHGSMPFLGHSAIGDMTRVLELVRDRLGPLAAKVVTELPVVPEGARRGSLNLNSLWGGQVPSGEEPAALLQSPCVADRCELVVDRRFVPEEELEEVRAQVTGVLGELADEQPPITVEIVDLLSVEPTRTPVGSPLVAALETSIQRVLGRPAEQVASPGTYDQKHFDRIAGIPHCVAYGPGELEQAHQPDESCSLAAMVEATAVMALTAVELLGVT